MLKDLEALVDRTRRNVTDSPHVPPPVDCMICRWTWEAGGKEYHRKSCPVPAARAALDKLRALPNRLQSDVRPKDGAPPVLEAAFGAGLHATLSALRALLEGDDDAS